MSNYNDDNLAYGDYHDEGQQGEGERGIIGDVTKRFFGRKPQAQQSDVTQTYQPHLQGQSPQGQPPPTSGSSAGGMSFVFDKLHSSIHAIGKEVKNRMSAPGDSHSHTHEAGVCSEGTHDEHQDHRFLSFAPQRAIGNDIKWYVDACGYMWAVSIALERAKESIWILDWWLSPELYLRRPPAAHEQYRLDRMLGAAAARGVKVNIIVYKEVTQALTRKLINPTIPDYLHSLLPETTDPITRFLTRAGLHVTFKSLEKVEEESPLIAPPILVCSAHTKHALEALHPNIAVFRHPDHLPDRQNLTSSFITSMQNMNFSTASLAKLPVDSLKAIYGMNDDSVLYWAHHEKLCLVDGQITFMGGLDLCYGRWDTNQHSIADAHPGNLDDIVFPGQDYNNARIMDFQDVYHWQNNKLDRTTSSRMGWSDVSLSLSGPVVKDLQTHFTQRWNFIYDEKYTVRKDVRYSKFPITGDLSTAGYPSSQPSRGIEEGDRGLEYGNEGERGFSGGDDGAESGRFRHQFFDKVGEGMRRLDQRYGQHGGYQGQQSYQGSQQGGVSCQLTRSCAKWSHGVAVEHSIANAYIEIIRNSQHFVYIENQFFITATVDNQKPIKNKIAAVIVERIIRAARNGENYKMMVMIPAIPAFAGDLKTEEALSTRAIMEFQYDSINRGGHSIYESIAREGINPMDYIRFYNLRSYDRINASGAMREAEKQSGVSYEEARSQHDVAVGGVYDGEKGQEYQAYQPPGSQPPPSLPVYEMDAGYGQPPAPVPTGAYQQYQQQGAAKVGGPMGSGRWDSVSECYMLGGEDIRNVPWEGGGMDEIDAFVSEELYIHSKLLIADDRIVICGSANLNDRSQLGDHDSEIALIIEDPAPVDSYMGGQPFRASKFASSLRRQLFRKHLGLLRPQVIDRPDANFEPIGVPNAYDWGSPEDIQVIDPISEDFQATWNYRAKTNTDAFARLFHPVPFDGVKNWKQYDDYYERFFAQDVKEKENKKPSLYKWGHVVAEEFSAGEQGLREVKEVLSTIKGTLVEMPLLFLKEEDIAKEGLGLNAFTEEVYT
ncbi:phospholipase D/nuclease [Mytilinidion resinicola]|uniref:Phospholipase n=1 Tax=Mytilinidion resinicola TaxID=574789 RepID=A0A6A6ZAB8_9PEZI|nr:phospholipase D/nuclease [Mytilinidion resinicola]KAF2817639.1 phospholipase D/nuclease [Mytilinidion resinicola]